MAKYHLCNACIVVGFQTDKQGDRNQINFDDIGVSEKYDVLFLIAICSFVQ